MKRDQGKILNDETDICADTMKKLSAIIVTGLSGSGKSTVIDALEDAGYFCVNNMPVLLLPKFLELRSESASEVRKLAFGMDLREKEFLEKHDEVYKLLLQQGYHLRVIFLEASEDVLLKRFSQTRRRHPVFQEGGLLESIRAEKEQLQSLKDFADRIIDTSNFTVHQLRDLIVQYADHGIKLKKMRISILSFGFKYGIPIEADLMLDVRFIPNPYFIPELKKLSGIDERVQQFVKKWPETNVFFNKYFSFLEYVIPLYEKEGKSYLTIAVGCTGGRHRSVTIAEDIYSRLKSMDMACALSHRDIELA